jgi:hypothetical protein
LVPTTINKLLPYFVGGSRCWIAVAYVSAIDCGGKIAYIAIPRFIYRNLPKRLAKITVSIPVKLPIRNDAIGIATWPTKCANYRADTPLITTVAAKVRPAKTVNVGYLVLIKRPVFASAVKV